MYFERIKKIIFGSFGDIDYDKSISELYDASKLDFGYIALVVLAAFIATLGLINNSSAVIIGAMIISPIMSPIMLSGASFAVMDKNMAKTAVVSVVVGVFVAIVCGMLTVYISPVKENTTEILARTAPNILDLFIAFFCGVAGALSVVSEKISKGVVGVAISVALMPPLCVGAFGLATMQAHIAIGGFWMFFLNMAAIFVAAFVVLSLFGYSSYFEARRQKHFGIRWIVSTLLLLFISIPLVVSLKDAITFKREQIIIKNELESSFDISSTSILQKSDVKKVGDKYVIDAYLDTVRSYDKKYVKDVEKNISKKLNSKVELFAVQRGVLSIGNGASVQFGLLDVLRPKVETKATTIIDDRLKKIEPLMRFADVSYSYDKSNDVVAIETNSTDISSLVKLQDVLSHEGITSSVSIVSNTVLYDEPMESLDIKNMKKLIEASSFALKNNIDLTIQIYGRNNKLKELENTASEIFGQNRAVIKTINSRNPRIYIFVGGIDGTKKAY
ncbi:MAG: TIGR00341 family protein [Campylobacterales bacterium]|nr:TIGR00341 family protein [Campylobacterales bacterium]